MKRLHPGEFLMQAYIEPMGISINKAALMTGVTPPTLHRLVSGASDCSTSMAVKLSQAFGTSPDQWLKMQNLYDLQQIGVDVNE